jgi:ribosome-associated toxin RatA of RatAB toxin-antitoxin module
MTTIAREIEINASKEEVWYAIAKFGDISHTSPGVLKSYVTSEKQEGVGATRHCDFTMMGATAEEKILEWTEGESLKIGVYELKKLPGIKTMEANFKVKEIDADKTMLTATLEYTMKNPLFDAMNNMMMKKMNIKNWNSVLAGHKKYIETGEIVTQGTTLELDKVIEIE